jgi:mxaA protein
MKRYAALAVLAIVFAPAVSAAAPRSAVVEQPRPFGYVIGDLVTQRVLLETDGQAFVPAQLPGIGQHLGVYLERRAARIEPDTQGRRWLAVDYQVLNVPQTLKTVMIPAWELRAANDATSLRVQEWPISLAPVTPKTVFDQGGLSELRPDRPAPRAATAPIRDALVSWFVALVVTLAAWLVWLMWRNRQDSLHRPFARAVRELRGLDERSPKAWYALHRAFDASAGRSVQLETLPALFERAPHLEPERPAIEQFFAQSSERFFGSGLSSFPMPVRELCAKLYRLEKQHAS